MTIQLSVVVHVYNEEANIPQLTKRLITSLDELNKKYEIIFTNDGSKDKSLDFLRAASAEHKGKIRIIDFKGNFGQHMAIIAAFSKARGEVIVTLDADLQNPPEELAHLLKALTDDVDVVYGVPRKIKQPIWRSVASIAAKRLMQKALGFSSAVDISSFRVFRSQLRDGFNNDLGPGVSLDALLSWSTSRFTSVEVEHHERKTGKSNYNCWKLFRFMLDTITGFSTVPLRLATSLGLTTIVLSVGVLVWALGRPLITGDSVPGFQFLAATVAIFSGTQLLVLGVIGQYIGRMHFRAMNKPTYTIAERTESK
jgi:undecaprenyl-phosphate 4-deoxy-4-formamido-L-arabinose transferase